MAAPMETAEPKAEHKDLAAPMETAEPKETVMKRKLAEMDEKELDGRGSSNEDTGMDSSSEGEYDPDELDEWGVSYEIVKNPDGSESVSRTDLTPEHYIS